MWFLELLRNAARMADNELNCETCEFYSEADIIRKYKKPGDYITTNGMFPNVDNHLMEKECLDVYMYDSSAGTFTGINGIGCQGLYIYESGRRTGVGRI